MGQTTALLRNDRVCRRSKRRSLGDLHYSQKSCGRYCSVVVVCTVQPAATNVCQRRLSRVILSLFYISKVKVRKFV